MNNRNFSGYTPVLKAIYLATPLCKKGMYFAKPLCIKGMHLVKLLVQCIKGIHLCKKGMY